MSIIRIHKTDNYTVMSNHHFKEKLMSLKAKGLLSLMLSLPDDWDYSVEGLSTLSSDGISAVRTALKELEEFGYLERQRIYKNGKINDIEYHIFEIPQNQEENLMLEKLKLENLILENQTSNKINNKQNKKEIKEKESISKEILEPAENPSFKLSSKKAIVKKPNLFTKCMNELDVRNYEADLHNALSDYLKVRLEIKDRPLYFNSWKGLLNKLDRDFKKSEQLGVVRQSIERGYSSFFPVSKGMKTIQRKCNTGLSSEGYTNEELEELEELKRERESKGIQTVF